MASADIDSFRSVSDGEAFLGSSNVEIKEGNPANLLPVLESPLLSLLRNCNIPKPPALPVKTCRMIKHVNIVSECCIVPKETRDSWDRLFNEGYGTDVCIITVEKSYIEAHSTVLSVASPVLQNILLSAKVKYGVKFFKISGVPHGAVRAFVRFLYSSCYEDDEMEKFVLHLLVLSHFYVVPCLKRVCECFLEREGLTKENVIDVLQLARNCDAPRLSLICVRMVVKGFKLISSTKGWKVMKHVNPALEQELVEAVVEAETRKQERLRKTEERKVYLHLHEAMLALLHICRDGCRTIGPCDKVLREREVDSCFSACKGIETLVRHFSGCKARVPGGCVSCKRMWQLLELHSRMCNEPDLCKVPLCRHFKEKIRQQGKKDEAKWRLLASKVGAAKIWLGPFIGRHCNVLCS